jgi:colicin import membrane protein
VVVAYATVKVLDPISGKWTVHGFPKDAIFPAEADPENVANLVRREYAEWLDAGEAKVVDKQETEAEKAEAAAAKQALDDAEAAAKQAQAEADARVKADAEAAEAKAKADAAAAKPTPAKGKGN